MQKGVVTCRVDATATDIANIMLDNDVSALVVLDESLDACGVVSKTDLIGVCSVCLRRLISMNECRDSDNNGE